MTRTGHVLSLCSCTLAASIVFIAKTAASDVYPDDQNALAAVDRYVTEKIRSSHIPGLALAIVKHDRIVDLKGYGIADSSGRPITPHTPFVIGSITKSFTALAVMQLVEAGAVDLDAPVQWYIPWFRVADPVASRQITVRHLLNMTSGLPLLYATQRWTDQDDGALERAVRYLGRVELSRPVGAFGYSNSNSETLGSIVQYVTGLSYEEYIKQHVFAPLAMRDSFLSQDDARRNGMATGHRWWFGIPIAVTLPFNRAELPAGYILSSAEDMSHFMVAQLNGGRYGAASILSPAGIRLTHSEPAPGTYGMGWEVVRERGRTLINHDGGTANFQSSVFLDPEARVGVFLSANVMNGLDALSSPHGSNPLLDGPTVRAMALSVLSLVSSRPLPDQGPGHERLTLLFDAIVLALSGGLILLQVRVPARRRRLARRGIASWSRLLRQLGVTAVSNFTVPVVVLTLEFVAPVWGVFALFQPDFAHWLYAVAAVLLWNGLFETASIWIAFREARRSWRAKNQHGLAAAP